jgi:hypothetical protein
MLLSHRTLPFRQGLVQVFREVRRGTASPGLYRCPTVLLPLCSLWWRRSSAHRLLLYWSSGKTDPQPPPFPSRSGVAPWLPSCNLTTGPKVTTLSILQRHQSTSSGKVVIQIELLKALLEDLLEADEKLLILVRVRHVHKDPNGFVFINVAFATPLAGDCLALGGNRAEALFQI